MVLRRATGVALAALLVSGCANNDIWAKPGATQQDFASDTNVCKKIAQSRNHGTAAAKAIVARGLEKRCLVAKGWVLQEQK